MRLSNKLVTSFACASALALTGGFAVTLNQTNTVQAAYSAINNQISSYGFGKPKLDVRTSTFTDDFEYNTGKPEGIVVHETATPGATAEDEAAYFLREWSKMGAYVHAFVDHTGVIQIHPTNRGVWGAGPVANGRFIQIELCQETTAYNFALSLNNDAYYIASLLKQYGLKPNLAEHDGEGTIWSHNAISNFYPESSNHSDPTGYFNKWGYSMDQFYDLILTKYNELMGNGGSVGPDYSLMGKTSTTGSPIAKVYYQWKVRVWSSPGKVGTNQYLDSLSSWKVTAKTLVNGKWWYQVGKNQWIDGQYLYVTGANSIKETGTGPDYSLMGKTSTAGSPIAKVYYQWKVRVWGKPGSAGTSQSLDSLSSWKVTAKTLVNGKWWYQVGKNQWIDGQYLYVTGVNSIKNINDSITQPPSGPDYSLMGKSSTTGMAIAKVYYKWKVRVWTGIGTGETNQYLDSLSSWKVTAKSKKNSRWWYQVGRNQWIDGQYLYVTGTNSIKEVVPGPDYSLMGKTSNTGSAIAKVYYKWKVRVWSGAGTGGTDQYLKSLSSWKVSAKTQKNGKWWYQVGKNQWLDGQYVYVTGFNGIKTVSSNNNGSSVPKGTIGTVKYVPGYSISVWKTPGGKAVPNLKLKHGTSWKVFSKTTYQGKIWYSLGKNQWVEAKYLTIK